jgi:uncharacterized protein
MDGATFAGFDWDEGNIDKCQKHGVSIDEIEGAFASGPLIGPDEAHSGQERRFRAFGRPKGGRPLFVVFTVRRVGGENLIRPISCRYMHAKEVRRYERTKGA